MSQGRKKLGCLLVVVGVLLVVRETSFFDLSLYRSTSTYQREAQLALIDGESIGGWRLNVIVDGESIHKHDHVSSGVAVPVEAELTIDWSPTVWIPLYKPVQFEYRAVVSSPGDRMTGAVEGSGSLEVVGLCSAREVKDQILWTAVDEIDEALAQKLKP